MLISFIIPSYNSAHTVKRCLDSIYTLSLKQEEFEVIFVDDCSTDNTCEVVEAYAQPLPKGKGAQNFVLLKQSRNNRQGAARNRGVSVAKGEYICFVDSDDAVTEGIVSAIRLAKEKKTDMVPYHIAFANENGTIAKEAVHLSFGEEQIFSGIEMQNKHPYWLSGPVAYVYNRAFLERVNYPFAEGVLYEDSDFVAVHMYHAKRMAYSKKLGYLAYEREGSTTRHTSYQNVADYLLLGERMMRFYERIKVESGKRKVESEEKFAEVILEGACFNVVKSCKRIIKLSSIEEVKAYYARVDAMANRKEISEYKQLRKYYWNGWTSLCMKHRRITIMILAILMPMYRLFKGCKL